MADILVEKAHITCLATFENPRRSLQDSQATFWDVLIPCCRNSGISPILCSTRASNASETIQALTGTYLLSLTIVPFRAGVHPPSAVRPDIRFSFMGDINHAARALAGQANSIQTRMYTGINAVGTVHETNTTQDSFSVVANQSIAGVNTPRTITIHAFLITSPQWPRPSEHLPLPNNIVRVSGELFSVEIDEPLMIVEKLEILQG
ncbi:hypothetical protein V8E53_013892 [Lactarius tabidus]